MNKVLIAIAHFGTKNRAFLHNCLDLLNQYQNYVIDLNLYITNLIDTRKYSNLNIKKYLYPNSIEHNLVLEHKNHFYQLRQNYDFYFYCEDDLLISEKSFNTAVEIINTIPANFTCGFLRYELTDQQNYKYLIDLHPPHSVHRKGNTIVKNNYLIKGVSYFEPYNIHQGCYLLSKNGLSIALTSKRYFENKKFYAKGKLEGAATDPYYKCGLIKIIPRSQIQNLLIHHLPNRYVDIRKDIYTKEQTPNEIKMKTWQLEIKPKIILSKSAKSPNFIQKLINCTRPR